MVVRFDANKTRQNTSADIGVEHDGGDKTAISEAEMIIGEARRLSGIPAGGADLTEKDRQDLQNMIISETAEEQQEPGPELTPGGNAQAKKALEGQSTIA